MVRNDSVVKRRRTPIEKRLDEFREKRYNLVLMRTMIADLEDFRAPIASYKERIGSSQGNGSAVENTVVKLEQLRDRYIGELRELLIEQEQLEEWVNALENPTHQAMIRLRYFDGKTWEEVAEFFGVNPLSVHRWKWQLFGK